MGSFNTYTDNWDGGESGSLSWISQINFNGKRQLNKFLLNENTIKLSFGETRQQNEKDRLWSKAKKASDEIDLESVLNFTLNIFVDPFIALKIQSTFWDITDTLRTRYINPVTVTESFGLARSIVEKDAAKWNVRLGGAVREFVDRKALNPKTLKRETSKTVDGGIEFVSNFKASNKSGLVNYSNQLTIIEALVNSKSDELLNDYWKYPDIEWDHIIGFTISKYLMATMNLTVKYDREKDIDPGFKTSSTLGLTYSIKN
jgi:hypothetical protein